MGRGVKAGTQRGHYRRHGKPRLKALAQDIRRGRIDAEAVAQAFEAAGGAANRAIAAHLRNGGRYNPERLASAAKKLVTRPKPCPPQKRLSLSAAKGALRHLDPMYGGKGLPVHKALGVAEFAKDPNARRYNEHPMVRAYYRQLVKDYGPRGPKHIEKRLNEVWAGRPAGVFPHLEHAVKDALLGHGVPLDVWRALRLRR